MKNNTAECVLLSPQEYIRLMDEIKNAHLLAEAAARTSHSDPDALLSDGQNDASGSFPKDYSGASKAEFE